MATVQSASPQPGSRPAGAPTRVWQGYVELLGHAAASGLIQLFRPVGRSYEQHALVSSGGVYALHLHQYLGLEPPHRLVLACGLKGGGPTPDMGEGGEIGSGWE
jgi:hypothetical protein